MARRVAQRGAEHIAEGGKRGSLALPAHPDGMAKDAGADMTPNPPADANDRAMTSQDLVDLPEIALRLHVAPSTPAVWRQRGIFPAPDIRLRVGDLWYWSTVEAWARATDRISSDA